MSKFKIDRKQKKCLIFQTQSRIFCYNCFLCYYILLERSIIFWTAIIFSFANFFNGFFIKLVNRENCNFKLKDFFLGL